MKNRTNVDKAKQIYYIDKVLESIDKAEEIGAIDDDVAKYIKFLTFITHAIKEYDEDIENLEDVETKEQIEIIDKDALEYIKSITLHGFRTTHDVYDNYVKLFDMLGVEPKTTMSAQTRASLKYDAKSTRQIKLKLNLKTDKDILKKLDEVENKQGYIKALIRKDIQ